LVADQERARAGRAVCGYWRGIHPAALDEYELCWGRSHLRKLSRGNERIRVRVAHPDGIVGHLNREKPLPLPGELRNHSTADRFLRYGRLLVDGHLGSVRLVRLSQRCRNAVEKRINLVFVVTTSSKRWLSESHVADLVWSERTSVCAVVGGVCLGWLTFEFGDALFGVGPVHQRIVPPPKQRRRET
jgi:hypothetical protein